MKVTVNGAAKIVTGSNYLIEVGKDKILIDCGMFQGEKETTAYNYDPFNFDPKKISYVLLTHAHIDHSGLLPKLYGNGFRGKIFATTATRDLCRIMLEDSANLQMSETESENKRRMREGQAEMRYPLYGMEEVNGVMPLFTPVEYERTYSITRNIQARFLNAGHIIGASIIELYVTEEGETKKIVFSGDLGQWDSPLLNDPTIIEEADYIFLESTYGNRLHDPVGSRDEEILRYVKEAYKKRGKLLIPSFAVERTQEIIYSFNKLLKEKKFPDEEVFIDSPLAIKAIEVFDKHQEFYRDTAFQYGNPLKFKKLVMSESTEDSKALNEYNKPAIIIAGNGMCTGGRIRHHLKHGLWNPKNTVLFVGFQAAGTLGKKILDGAETVKMMGMKIAVKADIREMNSYSAHSDANGLMKWMSYYKQKPRYVFVVHGEPDSCEEMKKKLKKQGFKALIPNLGETIDL
jgi:metallo-beta-lactamase family protein